MSDCNKCIHFNVCPRAEHIENYKLNGECEHFKDVDLVVVLPCRFGDTMYDIGEFVNCVPCPELYEDRVGFITIMQRKNGEMYFDIECVECDYNDFGKTIFFAKEEAEQALSKLQAS